MTVGDILEIAAGAAGFVGTLLVVAGLVSWIVGFGAALITLFAFLLYQGQVWSAAEPPWRGSTEEE